MIPKQFVGAFSIAHRRGATEQIDDQFAYKLLDRIIKSNYQDTEAVEVLTYLAKFNQEYHRKFMGDDPLQKCECYRPYGEKHKDDCLFIRVSRMLNATERDIMNVHERTGNDPLETHVTEQTPNRFDMEETLIDYIDNKNK